MTYSSGDDSSWRHSESKNKFQQSFSHVTSGNQTLPRSQFNRLFVLKFPSCPIRSAEHELVSVQLELNVRDVQDCLYSFRSVQ